MNLAGKKVMVTGGAGFLGRRVCTLLEERGVKEVIVPRSAEVDLTDQEAAHAHVAEHRPDLILHLAAEVGGIGANQASPGRYFFANMAMGLHLIEAARRYGVDKFVQIGTVCAYPKFAPVPFREDDLWEGYPEETNAPYGVAKKALLVMLQAYREQYGLNGIYLLPVNLYGAGDNFNPETSHVIPALIRKFVTARDEGHPTVEVWGTGSASREFLHADDAAAGIVEATAVYEDADPVNLATGREVTIKELVEIIGTLTGYTGEIVWDTTKPDGQPRRMLDTSRAKERFGWAAHIALEDGLRETIDWWETHILQEAAR